MIKVDFKVERAADLEKLKLAITRGWTPSQSWNSMIIAWTPMPGENEYAPVTAAATLEPAA